MNDLNPAAKANAVAFLEMLAKTMDGPSIAPRGLPIKEIEDLQLVIDPRYPFMSFVDRHYDVNYFRKEMRWKLGANKYDDSIKQHAKMWESVQNPDGTFNSNYGQFWFGEQQGFIGVVQELIRDPDSRRAVIPMLSKEHMGPHVVDTVCTESVGFRIRDGKLNMSVHMRSSDQIFGLGTDIPTFSFLYRLVYAVLRDFWAGELQVGQITLTAMSSHIYDRHFKMAEKILRRALDGYVQVEMPWCEDWREAMLLVSHRGRHGAYVPDSLARWILINEPNMDATR